MTDTRLQELKRAWEASGSVEDEVAYLRERVRVGDLTQERLELAAYCGHEGARATVQSWQDLPPMSFTEKFFGEDISTEQIELQRFVRGLAIYDPKIAIQAGLWTIKQCREGRNDFCRVLDNWLRGSEVNDQLEGPNEETAPALSLLAGAAIRYSNGKDEVGNLVASAVRIAFRSLSSCDPSSLKDTLQQHTSTLALKSPRPAQDS